MSSFLCVESIEVPINRYKCMLKCCDVVEGLLAGDVWEVLFVMAVPTLTSPAMMNPSRRNLCTTQYFPVNYIYLYIWACVCGQVRSSIPLRLFLSNPEHFPLPSSFPGAQQQQQSQEPSLSSGVCSPVPASGCGLWALWWCQLQGLVQLESAAFPSSDNMGCFQASLAAGQVLA